MTDFNERGDVELTIGDVLSKVITPADFAEALTLTDVESLTASKLATEAITATDSESEATENLVPEVLTVTDVLTKALTRTSLNESITITDSIPIGLTRLLTEAITITDVVARDTSKALSDSYSISDGDTWSGHGIEKVYGGKYKLYMGPIDYVLNDLAGNNVPAHRIIAIYYDAGIGENVAITKI